MAAAQRRTAYRDATLMLNQRNPVLHGSRVVSGRDRIEPPGRLGRPNFRRRRYQAFSAGHPGRLNQKAEAWWDLSLNQLGDALKQSFKVPTNPLKNPRLADEWEPYLQEKRAENARLTRAVADAKAELNDRVYRLFNLGAEEVRLLQIEVEH